MSRQLGRYQQSGYTIIELLIAGLLGLILLAGLGQLFLGSSATYNMQRQLADLQDNGRVALWLLKEDLEEAGWSANKPTHLIPHIMFTPNLESDAAVCPGGVCSVDGGGDNSDVLTISYEGVTDCNGSNVASGIVQNRYFVQGTQLLCQGNGGAAPQPLIENVAAFQVLYGLDLNSPAAGAVNPLLSCADRAVDRFVTLDMIPTALLEGNTVSSDVNIVSVRFALLLAGQPNNTLPNLARTYQVGDRSYDFNDQIPRRVFSLTVPLRNVKLPTFANKCPGP